MLQLLYESRARVSEFCRLKWKDIREKADGSEIVGIYGVSPHWIRHTRATHQLLNGSPIHLQQQELGHSGLDITSSYCGQSICLESRRTRV
jgi:site-specific recombinase XerD